MQSSARYASSHAFTNYRRGTADREQESVQEVFYLHSLWRQGPPLKRTRAVDVSPSEEGNSRKRAKIEPPSENKKKNKQKTSKEKKKRERREKKQVQKPSEEETPEETGKPQDPGKLEETENANKNWTAASDWDTNNPAQSTDCWEHSSNRKLAEPLTEGEQLHLANINLQHKAVRAFKDFLTRGREDESSEEDDEDEEEEVEEDEDEIMAIDAASVPSGGAIKKEADAQSFFVKLFEEDQELRQFYEQNRNCGFFECLVCAAVGAKLGKRFPDCVSLIQHAMKILKTKKKAAHRGYGRSICCLLGWNADRLPRGGKPIESQPRGCIPPPDEKDQEPQKDDNGKENEPIGENVSEDAADKADDGKPASS